MTENDNIKNKVKIKTHSSAGTLVVTASPESFSIALEGENPENPPPRSFCIPPNSSVYHTFGQFFQTCNILWPNSVLFDETEPIEHANFLQFAHTKQGIILRFACEKNRPTQILHYSSPNNRLTDAYITLYKNLWHIKRLNSQKEEVFDRA